MFLSITVHCRNESVIDNKLSGGTGGIDTHHRANQGSEANSTYYFHLSACTKMTCLQLTMCELET